MVESTTEAFLQRMAEAAPHCALLELRLDLAPPGRVDLAKLLAAKPLPVAVTCRPRREGGSWIGDEEERLDVLRRAAELGAEWIDVEWDALAKLGELPAATRLIVSRHRFQPTPELEPLFAAVRHPRAAVQKVAVTAGGAEDALRILRAGAAEAIPTLAVAMGDAGLVSRLAGPLYGAPWVYGAASPGRPGAPGQLPVAELAALLRGRALGPGSKLFGVLGNPVLHSRSPRLFNAAFARLGVDAVHAWLETKDPAAFLAEAAHHPRLCGLAVTLPHKVTVARALPGLGGTLGDEAIGTGAVNTLVRWGDGGWVGRNTDAMAAQRLVRRALAARGPEARAAVVGSGGAARAVAWSLARLRGQRPVLFARDETRGRALAAELELEWGGAPAALGPGFALVAHTTPVGMSGKGAADACLVPRAALGPETTVYELVYTPRETELVRRARTAGAPVIDGVEHFLLQAWFQLEAWVGTQLATELPPEALGTLLA